MKITTPHSVANIENLPGCTQVGVSWGMYVYPWDRGKGYGKAEHLERLIAYKKMGYDYVLCTVAAGNEAQNKLLEHWGWRRVSTFKSTKTSNTVHIWGRELGDIKA